MFTIDILFLNLANILYIVGSNFRDMLWLRIFMFFGGIAEIISSYFLPNGTYWPNIAWTTGIIAVHSVMITLLLKERGSLSLEEREIRIYKLIFSNMNKLQFKRLIVTAKWNDYEEGSILIRENEPVNDLMLISSGTVAINVDNKIVSHVRDGGFIGEISFLTGNLPSATVVAVSQVVTLSWEKNTLKNLLDKNPDLETALYSVFSSDLTKKIISSNKSKTK